VRDKANWDVLWNAVRTGLAVGDLHRPLRVPLGRQKTTGQGRLLEDPERRAGLEKPAAHDPRVRRRAGRISLNRMVELLATNPAKLFGSTRARARSPSARTRTSSSSTRDASTDLGRDAPLEADYNLYEGTEVTGTPEVVLLRGNVLVENDELVAPPGIGQFVKRAKFGEELKGGAAVVA
jgi:dihydropyrimidinase